MTRGRMWNVISFAVSTTLVTLLFNCIGLFVELDWDLAQEAFGILFVSSALAILVHQSEWDKESVYAAITGRIMNSKADTEKFILYVSFLLRTWETMVDFEPRHDETIAAQTKFVFRERSLQEDIDDLRTRVSARVIGALLILNLPLFYARVVISDIYPDIIKSSLFFIAIVCAAFYMIVTRKWLAMKVSLTTERAIGVLRCNLMEHFLSIPPLLDVNQNPQDGNEEDQVQRPPELEWLAANLQKLKQNIDSSDWHLFRILYQRFSNVLNYRAEQAILRRSGPRFGLFEQLRWSWRRLVIRQDTSKKIRFDYVRNVAVRLLVLGPDELQQHTKMLRILKLNQEEILDVHTYIAFFRGEGPLEISQAYERARDQETAEDMSDMAVEEYEAHQIERDFEVIAASPFSRISIWRIEELEEMVMDDEFEEREIKSWDSDSLATS
ncbi:MAG: hypothetical protein ACXABY_24300 [Candidatus Thorarchaeota archaeon]